MYTGFTINAAFVDIGSLNEFGIIKVLGVKRYFLIGIREAVDNVVKAAQFKPPHPPPPPPYGTWKYFQLHPAEWAIFGYIPVVREKNQQLKANSVQYVATQREPTEKVIV